jgi:hypothetical protein
MFCANPEQMGHVDNVRVANYASLPAANIGAPTPTDEIKIVCSVNRRTYDCASIFNFQLSIFNLS